VFGFDIHHGIAAATAEGSGEAGEERTDQQRDKGPQRGVRSDFGGGFRGLLGFELGVFHRFTGIAVDFVDTRFGIRLAEVGALADQLCQVGTVFWRKLTVVAQGAGEDARYHTVGGVIARAFVPGVEKASQQGRGIPLGRVGEPEDIARCALFLASDDASFISGAHIVADGGAMAASM